MYSFRIRKLTIDNFKAIEHGVISFSVNEEFDSSNILAIYGANGTGKSSVVSALKFLKSIMITDYNRMVLGNFAYDFSPALIYEGKEKASLEILIEWFTEENSFYLDYSLDIIPYGNFVSISNEILKIEADGNCLLSLKTGKKPSKYLLKNIIDECLPDCIDKKSALKKLYSQRCDTGEVQSMFYYLHRDYEKELWDGPAGVFVNELCDTFSKFDIFDDYMWWGLRLGVFNISPILYVNQDYDFLVLLLETTTSRLYNLNEELNIMDYLDLINDKISKCNSFLRCIDPDFKLSIQAVNNNGVDEVYLFSENADGQKIICTKESYGRMKILLLLSAFKRFLTEPDYCLIIDEFDEGIFEFLFGELVTVLKDYGVGQLIFTAHNLITAERLDNVQLCFTTPDVTNRFKRIPDVKDENNLRKIYFKELKGLRNGSAFHMNIDKDNISKAFTDDFGAHVF